MSYVFEIAKTAVRRWTKPVQDAAFLRYIRRFPCVVCGSTRRIEAAHIGPHAYGERTDDFNCLPLCFTCHQAGPRALHKIGPVDFQAVHVLDFPVLVEIFNRFYFLKTGAWAKGYVTDSNERRAA